MSKVQFKSGVGPGLFKKIIKNQFNERVINCIISGFFITLSYVISTSFFLIVQLILRAKNIFF